MPTLTVASQTESERLALEQAIAYVSQLPRPAQDAPDGTARAARARLALADGPALLRSRRAAAPARRLPGRPKGRHPRTVVTAVGRVTLRRAYFACPACGQGDFGADRVPGPDGTVTPAAGRMACLLGARQSFARAEVARAEVAGRDPDD